MYCINISNIPKLSNLYTTLRCNNNCLTCALSKKTEERQIKEIKKDIIKAKGYSDYITLTGAEPTIDKNFFKVLSIIKKFDFKGILLTSNGRMLSYKDFTEKIIQKNTITHFVISVHSFNNVGHNMITQDKNSFSQTIKAIKNLKDAGQFVMADIVISKLNYNYLPKIAKLLSSLNIDQVQQVYIRPIGFSNENYKKVVPSLNEIEKPLKAALDIYNQNKIYALVEGVPYCFMKDYEHQIGEPKVPDRRIFAGSFSKHISKIINRDNKVKSFVCKRCAYDQECTGVWKETRFNLDYLDPVKKDF